MEENQDFLVKVDKNKMKKLLGIVVLGLLLSSNADAGFFKDLFSFGGHSTTGCAYDEFGEEIKCVSIKYGGNGLTWDEATNECVSYLKRYVDLDVGTIGGCI